MEFANVFCNAIPCMNQGGVSCILFKIKKIWEVYKKNIPP